MTNTELRRPIFRTGCRNDRNIYCEVPDPQRHGDGSRLESDYARDDHIGCMFTEDDGRLVVEALNYYHMFSDATLPPSSTRYEPREILAGRIEYWLGDNRDVFRYADTLIDDLERHGFYLTPRETPAPAAEGDT